MPDYAETATPRYLADYRCGGLEHTFQVRGFREEPENTTVLRATGMLFNWLNALTSVLAEDFAWLSARYIPQDSNVSHVADTPLPVVGTVPVANLSPMDKISALRFPAKSSRESRSYISVFGFNFSPDTTPPTVQSKFKLYATEAAFIATAIDALNAAGAAAIDGGSLRWYNYCTFKPHDHYMPDVRQGLVT